MNGAIIVPTFYKKRHLAGNKSQRSRVLLNALSKKYGMPFIYTDSPNLKGLDVALIYAVPYHNRPKIPSGLLETKTKLISYFEDLGCWDNKECLRNKETMFEKYDILMGACYKSFKEMYPQHMHKYVHFPNFFFPLQTYKALGVNPRPKMKCLMAGALNSFYPSRMHIQSIARKKGFKLLDIVRVPFAIYAKTLNNYFCAIATTGRMGNVLAKYLEIPAAGTLLLAEKVMELEIMGMEPDIHYVSITRKNVLDKIQYVLSNPDRFLEMRIRTMNFVHKSHSDINRAFQFKGILERLMGNNLDV